MTFLTSEDDALRSWLSGMTVSDQYTTGAGKPRPVKVRFGQPDQELADQNYPYITIDLIDITRDAAREMRGKVSPGYLAPTNLASGMGWEIDLPIPVNLDYQITTYCRHPRHDRDLISQILTTRIPFRFGQLSLDDGTLRRLELLGISKRDAGTEQAKRLFVNAITVRVSSELVQAQITELYQVLSVSNSFTSKNNNGNYTSI